MERLHDRPFQDFVAHETHRLIPRFVKAAVDPRDELIGMNATSDGCQIEVTSFGFVSAPEKRKKL